MTRSSKKLLLLAATLATSLNSLTTLEAGCHGSSGRRVYSSHNYDTFLSEFFLLILWKLSFTQIVR